MPILPHDPVIRARELRKVPTKAEKLLWTLLRDRRLGGVKFRRQYAFGPYFADFFCVSHRLAVELDGTSHEERLAYDQARDAYFRQHGILVLRFRNEDLARHPEAVWDRLRQVLAERAPQDADTATHS